jgi:acyl-CoA thioesterase-1
MRRGLFALGAIIGTALAGWSPIALPATAPGTILVLGDSISAEYGLPRDSGWVKLLGDRLKEQHLDYSVENASISGETTGGGLARLPELLQRVRPAVVIVELGANDGLRGLAIDVAHDNLAAIVRAAEAAHARVLVVGMQLPPNYGPDYTQRFAAMFADVASRYHTALVPGLLNDFGARRDLFQEDGLHPTAAAQPHLRDEVWEKLLPLLR